MKAYVMWNYDGVNSVLVAAADLKEAAARLGTSVHHMRQMGWQYARADDLQSLAFAANGAPLYRPMDARGTAFPWREKRYHRSRSGGWE